MKGPFTIEIIGGVIQAAYKISCDQLQSQMKGW